MSQRYRLYTNYCPLVHKLKSVFICLFLLSRSRSLRIQRMADLRQTSLNLEGLLTPFTLSMTLSAPWNIFLNIRTPKHLIQSLLVVKSRQVEFVSMCTQFKSMFNSDKSLKYVCITPFSTALATSAIPPMLILTPVAK